MKSPFFWRIRWAALGILLAASAILEPHSSAHTRVTNVTWAKDVAPIVQRRCAGCHSPGGGAPIALGRYEEVKSQARLMRDVILEGRMPPWPAAKGLGDFSNDGSLSPIELELMTAWADGDTPLGNAEALRPAPAHPEIAPDLIIRLSAAPIGRARTGRLEARAENRRARWISGWSFRPGNAALVERAVVSIVGGGRIGSWVPGDAPVRFPPDVAQRLPAGATLSVEIHYRKSSATEIPASTLELSFRDAAERTVRHRSLGCDANPVGESIEALAITPLAAAAGDSVEIVAQRPGGSIEPLIVIPEFDPGYPVTYRFRNPVALPRGTTVRVRGSSPGCSADFEFTARTSGRAGAPRQ